MEVFSLFLTEEGRAIVAGSSRIVEIMELPELLALAREYELT